MTEITREEFDELKRWVELILIKVEACPHDEESEDHEGAITINCALCGTVLGYKSNFGSMY